MRQIKFRGKRVDNGEWVYGDLNQNPIHYDCQIIENGVIHHSVIRETVGQYTGLTDRNGKDIYENDICLTDDSSYIHIKYGESAESFSRFNVGFSTYGYTQDLLEVTGNIHNNPGLLDK